MVCAISTPLHLFQVECSHEHEHKYVCQRNFRQFVITQNSSDGFDMTKVLTFKPLY